MRSSSGPERRLAAFPYASDGALAPLTISGAVAVYGKSANGSVAAIYTAKPVAGRPNVIAIAASTVPPSDTASSVRRRVCRPAMFDRVPSSSGSVCLAARFQNVRACMLLTLLMETESVALLAQ